MSRVIWSNINLDYEDWREDLEEEYPDLTEQERYEMMVRINDDYFWDEIENLNIELPEDILVFANLGLWDGLRFAYKDLGSNNIRDCLSTECDYAEWFVDDDGDLCMIGHHHDGSNDYRYRMIREDISDDERDDMWFKFGSGTLTESDIEMYTTSLGKYIAPVYGWKI